MTIESILDAIVHPLESRPPKINEFGRTSFQLIGSKTTIAINPDTGVITTTWLTKTKLANKLIGQRKGEK